MQAAIHFTFLFAFWALLSGKLASPLLVGTGLVACGFTTWLSFRLRIVNREDGILLLRTVRYATYFPWLLVQVVLANMEVALIVWRPRLRIDPRNVEVPCETRTALGQVVYANSITLTPGTVSIRVGEGKILVHALNEKAAANLATGRMLERIRRAEGGSL